MLSCVLAVAVAFAVAVAVAVAVLEDSAAVAEEANTDISERIRIRKRMKAFFLNDNCRYPAT